MPQLLLIVSGHLVSKNRLFGIIALVSCYTELAYNVTNSYYKFIFSKSQLQINKCKLARQCVVLLLISVAVDPRLNYVFLQAMIDFQEAEKKRRDEIGGTFMCYIWLVNFFFFKCWLIVRDRFVRRLVMNTKIYSLLLSLILEYTK